MATAIAEPEPQAADIKVTEAHKADPIATNLGEIWKEQMAKSQEAKQGKATVELKPKKAKSEPVVTSTEPEKVEPTPEAPKDEKPSTKPANALEAALETPAKKEEPVKEGESTEEIFKGEKPNWAKAREGMDRRDTKITELATLITELKKPNPELTQKTEEQATRIQQLEEQLNSYKDAIVGVNIELEPEFRKEFIEGRAVLANKAVSLVKAYGGNSDLMTEALSLPEGKLRDSRISEALGEEMAEGARAKIFAKVAEIEGLDERASEKRANSQQTWQQYERKNQERSQKQSEEAEIAKKDIFEKVTRKLSESSPIKLVDASMEGADKYNQATQGALENALRLHSDKATPQETMEVAAKGSHYDFMVGTLSATLKDTQGKLQQAETKLAEYEVSQPDVKGTKKPPTDSKAPASPSDYERIYQETLLKSHGNEDV